LSNNHTGSPETKELKKKTLKALFNSHCSGPSPSPPPNFAWTSPEKAPAVRDERCLVKWLVKMMEYCLARGLRVVGGGGGAQQTKTKKCRRAWPKSE
jgi:hypothetical protein